MKPASQVPLEGDLSTLRANTHDDGCETGANRRGERSHAGIRSGQIGALPSTVPVPEMQRETNASSICSAFPSCSGSSNSVVFFRFDPLYLYRSLSTSFNDSEEQVKPIFHKPLAQPKNSSKKPEQDLEHFLRPVGRSSLQQLTTAQAAFFVSWILVQSSFM